MPNDEENNDSKPQQLVAATLDDLPMAAELFDEEDPRSLVNLLPPVLAHAFRGDMVNKKMLYLSEREAERRLSPEPVVYKIRIAFWKEFESARVTGRAISLRKISELAGLPEHYTRSILVHREGALTFCLVPPTTYELELEEALSYGMRRLREDVLTLPLKRTVYNEDGTAEEVPIPENAKILLQAVAFLDMRKHGGIVQKAVVAHKDLDAGNRKMDKQMLADLDQKIKELEQKAREQALLESSSTLGVKVVSVEDK